MDLLYHPLRSYDPSHVKIGGINRSIFLSQRNNSDTIITLKTCAIWNVPCYKGTVKINCVEYLLLELLLNVHVYLNNLMTRVY